jgi:putative ABC transport system permease protein
MLVFVNFLRQCARASIASLLNNKTRSFLTMLGIIIGVAAVIIILALGAGAQGLIIAQVENLGTNKIGILPGKSDSNGPPASAMGIVITTLKYEDSVALRNNPQAPHIIGVDAYNNSSENLSYENNSYITNVRGVAGDYFTVEGGEVADGRFMTDNEMKSLSRLVVLGDTVKQQLFGDSSPVGKQIKIKNHPFEVIGVMKKRGKVAFQDYDDLVLIPNLAMRKTIMGIDYLNFIRAAVDDEKNMSETAEEAKAILRTQHGITDQTGANDDFDVRSSADALKLILTFTNALKLFLTAMASLSLLVGGIGIMNIMLVRVNERTREIGLRKAVGASNGKITLQFLIETMIITLIGGLIGLLIGTFVSYIAAIIIRHLGYAWNFSVTIFSVILAIGVSASIGFFFGLYPARKAAKMDPVEALRYE